MLAHLNQPARAAHSLGRAIDAKPTAPNNTNVKSHVIISHVPVREPYKPLCHQPERLRDGGSVQQGLSAAFNFVPLSRNRGVVAKCYSLEGETP